MSVGSAPRVVVDTNLFVSGMINPRGRPRQLLRAWYDDRFVLVLSSWQYDELIDVLARPKFERRYKIPPQDLEDLVARISIAPQVVPSTTAVVPVRDSDDEHILAAAIGGKADYLVTGDKDLLVLQGDPRLGALLIVNAAEFLTALAGAANDAGASW